MLRHLLLLLALAPLGLAQSASDLGSEIQVPLKNGDVLTGTLIESNVYTISIDHPLLGGTLTIARSAIAAPAEAAATAAAAAQDDEPAPEGPWSGSVELSVFGSTGNTHESSRHAVLNLRRETEATVDTHELSYRWSESRVEKNGGGHSDDKTADRLFARTRREWTLADSAWRPFGQFAAEFDEFSEWARRYAVHAGVGRELYEGDGSALTGRVGAGASREFGGPNHERRWDAEGMLGVDYWNDIADGQRITASVEVYQGFEGGSGYRSISRAGWQQEVFSEQDPWLLKLVGEHFRDSTPAGDDHASDLNYYASLGYSF